MSEKRGESSMMVVNRWLCWGLLVWMILYSLPFKVCRRKPSELTWVYERSWFRWARPTPSHIQGKMGVC